MMISITQQNIPDAPASLHSAYETLTKALKEVRTISKMLNKEWLEQFNLVDNLSVEAEHLNSSNIVKVHISSIDNLPLNIDKQIICENRISAPKLKFGSEAYQKVLRQTNL